MLKFQFFRLLYIFCSKHIYFIFKCADFQIVLNCFVITSAFVNEMNNRAKELGMNNTAYANSTGLHSPNQYSTAIDTAKIIKKVEKHDLYIKDSNIWMDKFVHPSGRETELVNTNRLIKYYDKCKAGKTGFTDEAGYCLASSASNDSLNLIAVTLKCTKAQDRFKESMDLYNYGFANYESKKIIDSNLLIEKCVNVSGGKLECAKIGFANDYSIVCKKGDKSNFDVKLEYAKVIKAPLKTNHVVGCATIVNEGKIIGEVDIVLKENVEKQNFSDIIIKLANKWAIFNN